MALRNKCLASAACERPSRRPFPKKHDGLLLTLKGSFGPLLMPRQETQPSIVISVDSAPLVAQTEPGARDVCTYWCFCIISTPSKREVPYSPLGLSLAGLRAFLRGSRGPKTTPRSRPLRGQILVMFCGCRRATERAQNRETRGWYGQYVFGAKYEA